MKPTPSVVENLGNRVEVLEQRLHAETSDDIGPAVQEIIDRVKQKAGRVKRNGKRQTAAQMIAELKRKNERYAEKLSAKYAKERQKRGQEAEYNTPVVKTAGPTRYRCLNKTVLGTGQFQKLWYKGQVWDFDEQRAKVLREVIGNPTEARICEIMARVCPQPREGEDWEAISG